MPQLTLTDGEILKKTLRTTLLMVGTTALWLGALSGLVMATTGSASEHGESKLDRGAVATPPGLLGPTGPAAVGGVKSMHRPTPPLTGSDGARSGDPI